MNKSEGYSGAEERIGRYRLIGVLAEGGMARLYLAEQSGPRGFKKVAAVKRVLPHLADRPEFREMFLREAMVAARLEHPSIVTAYELGEVDGQYFISMEYLPGEDLAAIQHLSVERGPMPIPVAVAISHHCADALHYAHSFVETDGKPVCIVHRDVNPTNIIVTYHGEVKLLDFGIAKVRRAEFQTVNKAFKGKPSYAAPEQLTGEELDGRTDIFCLGIVLWECLTGKRLFDGPSEAARMDAVKTRSILPPSTIRKDIPPELDAITLRALDRNRDARFSNAAEMCSALDAVLTSHREQATPRALGAWLESVFGAERAGIKRSMAQGHDLEKALAQLHRTMPRKRGSSSGQIVSMPAAAERLRRAWSSDRAGGPSMSPSTPDILGWGPPPPAIGSLGSATVDVSQADDLDEAILASEDPSVELALPSERVTQNEHISSVRPFSREEAPRSFTPHVAAISAVVLLLAGGGVFFHSRRPAENELSARTGASMTVESTPPKAQIFVDGEPTGIETPALIRDLPLGRRVEVQVVKPGYAAERCSIELTGTPKDACSFVLKTAVGAVRFKGLPASARVYVDGARIDVSSPIELSIGQHTIRAESSSDLLVSRTIEVSAGDQVVDLTAERK